MNGMNSTHILMIAMIWIQMCDGQHSLDHTAQKQLYQVSGSDFIIFIGEKFERSLKEVFGVRQTISDTTWRRCQKLRREGWGTPTTKVRQRLPKLQPDANTTSWHSPATTWQHHTACTIVRCQTSFCRNIGIMVESMRPDISWPKFGWNRERPGKFKWWYFWEDFCAIHDGTSSLWCTLYLKRVCRKTRRT